MSSEIARRLSDQTRALVSMFEARVDSFSGRDDLLALTKVLDMKDADAFAREYFGQGDYLAFGVDGSMGFDERMQMMLFYANATAYSCPFHVGRSITFDVKEAKRSAAFSSSAAVPLWSEDFSDVLADTPETDAELEYSAEKIPNALMTLGELHLAAKSLERAKVLFLDRPLSATYSALARDFRRLVTSGEKSRLAELKYNGKSVSMLDLQLALYLGSPDTELPRRGRLLRIRVIKELTKGPFSVDALSRTLSASEKDVKRAVDSLKRSDLGDELFSSTDESSISLRDGVTGYWDRAVNLTLSHATKVFEEEGHPLSVSPGEWLSVLDLSALCFIMLERVCELARMKRALVIGIAKDTTAMDINRAVLPFARRLEIVKGGKSPPKLRNDRAFLTILSGTNERLKTPWRTLGYDSVLSTMIVSDADDDGFRSARKYVSREKLFVRGFFQIRTLGDRGKIRSRVFLFDRLYSGEHDSESTRKVTVMEKRAHSVVEPYLESGESRLSNLALRILSLNDNPEVFEAFGHNQLLYLADKAVKAELRLMRGSLRAVADLRLGTVSRREKLYGIGTTYREERAEMEGARRLAPRT